LGGANAPLQPLLLSYCDILIQNAVKNFMCHIKARGINLLRAAAQGPQTGASINILDIKHRFWKLCTNPLIEKCQKHT